MPLLLLDPRDLRHGEATEGRLLFSEEQSVRECASCFEASAVVGFFTPEAEVVQESAGRAPNRQKGGIKHRKVQGPVGVRDQEWVIPGNLGRCHRQRRRD